MTDMRTQDAGKIATALGLLSSCVKSGEDWSEHCEKAKNEAFDALARLSLAPQAGCAKEGHTVPLQEFQAVQAACEHFRTALEDVVNPLGALRRHAETKGARLNEAASYIANDIYHIQSIARAALSASPPPPVAESGWQEIETAPKDGLDILVATAHPLVRVAFWDTARGGVWSIWPG